MVAATLEYVDSFDSKAVSSALACLLAFSHVGVDMLTVVGMMYGVDKNHPFLQVSSTGIKMSTRQDPFATVLSIPLSLSRNSDVMLASVVFGLLLAAPYVRSTALTAMLNGNERSCYYADVDGAGEKVGESPKIRNGMLWSFS